jgi:hypothetical protein
MAPPVVRSLRIVTDARRHVQSRRTDPPFGELRIVPRTCSLDHERQPELREEFS